MCRLQSGFQIAQIVQIVQWRQIVHCAVEADCADHRVDFRLYRSQSGFQIVQMEKWFPDCADHKFDFRLYRWQSGFQIAQIAQIVQWRQIVQIAEWISDCADCAVCSGGRLCRSKGDFRLCRWQSGFQIAKIVHCAVDPDCADGRVVCRLQAADFDNRL